MLVVSLCLGWLVLATGLASADTRHHITIGLGYTKLPSSDLKDDALGMDFSNAANGVLAYRYTLNPAIDLTLDSRGTASSETLNGADLWLLNSFFGPGVRWHPMTGTSRLYLQGNFFLVSEQIDIEQNGVTVSSSESGTGFGLAGGVDIPLSRLLSLPLEANYTYGKPADDVSGFGLTIGLAFNFGVMP
jgi:opacity protein-like surface antigen